MSRINDIWLRKPAGAVYANDWTAGRTTDVTGKVGTLTNGASISGTTLVLSGANQYLSVPDSDDLSFGNGGTDVPFSVSVWFKTTAPTTRQFIISKRTASIYEWQFEYRATTNAGLEFVFAASNASSIISRYDAGTTLTSGQWYHAVATYSGNKTTSGMKIYQDSVRVDDTSGANPSYAGMSNTTNPVTIGCLPPNILPMTGSVGTTIIFNRELTQPEIAQIYNAGAARIALGGTP